MVGLKDLSAAVSCLPVGLLAETFLNVVEPGLEDGNTCFAAGAFSFIQIYKHWNEVAVNTPQLLRWWVAGAAEAWPLFNSRAEGIRRGGVGFPSLREIIDGSCGLKNEFDNLTSLVLASNSNPVLQSVVESWSVVSIPLRRIWVGSG